MIDVVETLRVFVPCCKEEKCSLPGEVFGRAGLRIDQESTTRKPGHFRNLSSKFRRNKHSSEKQKVFKESKMVIVPFKPTKLTLCLGYGGDSPRA